MLPKKKESFAVFSHPGADFSHFLLRQPQKAQQLEEDPRPEIPQRAKQGREERKKRPRAHRRGKHRIKAQLSVPDAQGKRREQQRRGSAVQRVQRRGEPGNAAQAQTQRAQQVVEQRQRHSQQCRGSKQARLRTDLNAHQPPKMRRSSPPEPTAASS